MWIRKGLIILKTNFGSIKKMTVPKCVCIIIEINFPWRHETPKTPVAVINNSIHSQNNVPNLWLISQSRWQGIEKSDIYGETQPSHDCKTNFALKHILWCFCLVSDYSTINVKYESRMKWTGHHSKLTVEEVSFYRKFNVILLQLMEQSALGILVL